MKANILDVIEVVWVDSAAGSGWQEISADTEKPSMIVSAGILAYESMEMVTLALAFDKETNEWNGLLSIPRVSIKKRRRLCQIKMS